MLIHGGCHCGNIGFALRWDPDPVQIATRACGCSFCVAHGGVWTSKPDGELVVAVREPAALSKYLFGTRTAEFQVCSHCGVVPLVTCEIDGRVYAVVNVNTFRDIEPSLLQRANADFEGENAAARLERRKRNWIGKVHFATA